MKTRNRIQFYLCLNFENFGSAKEVAVTPDIQWHSLVMVVNLNAERALIFRIVHLHNIPWILDHGGLHCRNSPEQDPNYVNIGNVDLIDKRSRRAIPVPPGGTLSDYVPFYFTPFSIMMYNIHTGYGGITRRDNREIVMFVSSIYRIQELGLPFLFTNQHAYPIDTEYFDKVEKLDQVDWAILQNRNFKTDDEDPGKQSRYQAEALIHKFVPLEALTGLGCANAGVQEKLAGLAHERGLTMSVKVTPSWYF